MPNKSKAQIADDMRRIAQNKHVKEVVQKIFPLLKVPTIYDGQTVVNAIAGFIKADLEEKTDVVKMSEVVIDLSKEKENEIKTSMVAIIELMKDEKAQDLSQILEKMGQVFSQYGSEKFLKNPMSSLLLNEILKE